MKQGFKNLSLAFVLAAGSILAGCNKTAEIAPRKPQSGDLSAVFQRAQVFNGAEKQHKKCVINSSSLKEGEAYSFSDGLLVINGDFPCNAKLIVDNGKLHIKGNIGEGAGIAVEVAELTKKAKKIRIRPRTGYGFPVDRGLEAAPVKASKFAGFKYPDDKDPAVIIDGNVHRNVEIQSNYGIHVNGIVDLQAELVARRGTKVTTISNLPALVTNITLPVVREKASLPSVYAVPGPHI